MDNSFNVNLLKEPLKSHVMSLVKKSMETFEDVGLVIENDGDARFDKGAFSVRPKSIFRARRVDMIAVHEGEELQTIGIEIQIVKGERREAGKTAWFFKVPLNLNTFQNQYPGYDLAKLIVGLFIVHDSGGNASVKISGVYSKDDHLSKYLNEIFGSMVRHTRKINKDTQINLSLIDNGNLIANLI